MTAIAASTTRQAVVDRLTDLRAFYACARCGAVDPCDHTPPLGTEAGDDAARLLSLIDDLMPLLTDDAVALVADRLQGAPDA